MAQTLTQIIADFDTQLSTASSIGGTTATIVTATDDDGNALPTGTYGLTIDAGSSSKEYIVCTLTGTSLTDIQNITRQGVVSSGFAKSHRRGAKVTITDWAIMKRILNNLDGTTGFNSSVKLGYDADPAITSTDLTKFATVKFVNDTSIAGAPDATTATKGISKLSTAPISATNPIAVGDNDPRVPTQGENDALVGTSGTPSSSNKYVTEADTTGTGSVVRNSVLSSYAQGVISYTAGENITAGQAVYLKQSDGKVYRTSPVQGNETLYGFVGVAANTATTNNPVNVQTIQGSLIRNQSFGSKTSTVSSTAFLNYSGAGGVNQWEIRSGASVNYYAFVVPNNVNNIEKIAIRGFTQFGTGGGNVILRLYKPTLINISSGTGITAGTQVGSVTLTSISTNTATFSNTFTFSSPVSVTPGEWYAFTLEGQSGGGGNSWYAQMVSGSYAQGRGTAYFSASAGYFFRGIELGLQVYTTSNFNYNDNDNVFLNGSTGGISTQWGTDVFPVGKVVSSSSFILDTSQGTKLINSSTPNIMTATNSGSTTSSVVVIPKNAKRMVASIGVSSGGSTFRNIFDINISDVVTNSPIFGYGSEISGTPTLGTLQILRNETCTNVNLAEFSGNLSLDSGSYIRFYN